jgi:hypothetical protein
MTQDASQPSAVRFTALSPRAMQPVSSARERNL